MILFIDTSTDQIILALGKEKVMIREVLKSQHRHSEILLLTIDKFLKKNKLKLENLTGLIVNIGPGHYTGLRVGIVTANTLSFALKIPVVGIKNSKAFKVEKLFSIGKAKLRNKKFQIKNLVRPFYGQKLRISRSHSFPK